MKVRSALSTILEVIGGLAVLFGVVVGLYQVRPIGSWIDSLLIDRHQIDLGLTAERDARNIAAAMVQPFCNYGSAVVFALGHPKAKTQDRLEQIEAETARVFERLDALTTTSYVVLAGNNTDAAVEAWTIINKDQSVLTRINEAMLVASIASSPDTDKTERNDKLTASAATAAIAARDLLELLPSAMEARCPANDTLLPLQAFFEEVATRVADTVASGSKIALIGAGLGANSAGTGGSIGTTANTPTDPVVVGSGFNGSSGNPGGSGGHDSAGTNGVVAGVFGVKPIGGAATEGGGCSTCGAEQGSFGGGDTTGGGNSDGISWGFAGNGGGKGGGGGVTGPGCCQTLEGAADTSVPPKDSSRTGSKQ